MVDTCCLKYYPRAAPAINPATKIASTAYSCLTPATLARSLNPNAPPIPEIVGEFICEEAST